LLVSAQWCLYGVLVNDIYIIIPNGAGVALAFLQISLFLMFPRQAGSRAPLAMCFSCLDFELDEKPNSIDIEKAVARKLVAGTQHTLPVQSATIEQDTKDKEKLSDSHQAHKRVPEWLRLDQLLRHGNHHSAELVFDAICKPPRTDRVRSTTDGARGAGL